MGNPVRPYDGGSISDEQIRGLHEEAWHLYVTALRALGIDYRHGGGGFVTDDEIRVARHQCADVLNKRVRNYEYLCFEYKQWQAAHGLRLGSADEVDTDTLTTAQAEWIRGFCARWDALVQS